MVKSIAGSIFEFIEKRGFQCVKMVVGSALMVGYKFLFVVVNEQHTVVPMWLCYLFVIVSLNFVGWIYHTKITFGIGLSVESLKRYTIQSIAFKIADFGLFNFLVYSLGLKGFWSVTINIAILYVLRMVVYIKYVYK